MLVYIDDYKDEEELNDNDDYGYDYGTEEDSYDYEYNSENESYDYDESDDGCFVWYICIKIKILFTDNLYDIILKKLTYTKENCEKI